MISPKNIVFIDSRIADKQTLIASLGVDSAWVLIHPGEDGIRQMQLVLRERNALDSIRILAHGRPGVMMLGAGQIDAKILDQQVEALAEIGGALSADGDVQLYCCELGRGPTGRAFVDALAESIGAHVAAASMPVGHADLGGSWKLDVGNRRQPGLDLPQWHGVLAVSYITPTANNWQRSYGEWMNGNAFAALRADGSVVTWGISTSGGDSSSVAAALNGSIDVVQIFSTPEAFAALRADGSVVTWGHAWCGGDSSSVANALDGRIDVVQVFSTPFAGAFAALRADGSVVTWGDTGGDSSGVAAALDGHIDVVQVSSTIASFAALRGDGSVVTWGHPAFGGDSSSVAAALDGSIAVVQIFSTGFAFAALRADGSVVTWAHPYGDSSGVATALDGSIDVVQIFSTQASFAALRTDGSVVTWANATYGGDSSGVAAALDGSIDAVQVFSTQGAFAALRADGSVVSWGSASAGGDSSGVAGALDGSVDVLQVFSGSGSFAALRADGSVVTWGSASAGGNSSGVAAALDGSVDVVQIFATGNAFAALRADGSVVTWGDTAAGGDSSGVAAALDGSIDVVQIFATGNAFAALRADGSVVTWGDTTAGGDSDSVADQLHDVIGMASPLPTEGYKLVIGGIAYSYFDAYSLGGSEQNGRVMSRANADLAGNGLANTLYAGSGDNVLDGLAGADTASYAYAGTGVAISLATTRAQDTEGSGIDTLRNIENLTGSAHDDILTGNSGANTLNGGAGADVLTGREGSDVYLVDNLHDVVAETNATASTGGTDIVHSYLSSYSLGSNVENGRIMNTGSANLTGNALNNYLCAGQGNNVIDGGNGADTVIYFYGVAGTAGVTVSLATTAEQATGGSGTDTLVGIEHLRGSTNADRLTGNTGANRIEGYAGNDTIDGGAGIDTLVGGDGNDAYYVRDAGDTVSETIPGAGTGGNDIVYSYLSAYTLGANVERGRIMSTGAANLAGNDVDNLLYAGRGNNRLDGGSGVDTVTYAIGVAGTAGVTVSLASAVAQTTGGSGTDILSGIENLTGSGYADTLTGNAANNILIGGAGKDTLRGNGGNDTFDFNALAEMGTTSLTRDVIADFGTGDKIDLSSLDANTASGTNDSFIYLGSVAAFTGTGQLRYDAAAKVLYGNTDANLATAEFAIQLTGVTNLTTSDFVL